MTPIAHMLTLEAAADDWFHRMSAHEQEAYLRAHPASAYGRRGHAVLRAYLGGEGAERDAAGRALDRLNVPRPERPAPRPRWEKFTREPAPRRSASRSASSPSATRSRGVPTSGRDAISAHLVDKFRAGPPDEERGVLSHRTDARGAHRLHDALSGGGWTHESRDINRDHLRYTMNTYRHPDGGHVVHVMRHGQGTITGRDSHHVYVHGD